MKTSLGFGDLALFFKITVGLNRTNFNQIEIVCKIYGHRHKKTCLGFPTKGVSDQSPQLQRLVRKFKFHPKQVYV